MESSEETSDEKMPLATRLVCQIPNCNLGQGDETGQRYVTPAHLARIEETQKDMEQHLLVHQLIVNGAKREDDRYRPKLEAITRPSLKEGSTEGGYQFFVHEWKQYKESSTASEKELLKQLTHCVGADIRRKLFESNLGGVETEETILKHLKRLCVKSQNRLVNVVEFGEMMQGQEEPVAVTLARLRGAAANCGFKIKCSKDGCAQEVDYSEDMIAYQLVRGLADTLIQEEVLSKEATNPNMALEDIVKLIEAKEQSKRSQTLLGGGILSSIKHEFKDKRGKARGFKKCYNCGLNEHGISRSEKQRFCKAYKHVCDICKKVGHFESQCRRNRASENTIEQECDETEEIGAYGEFFALEKLESDSIKLLEKREHACKMRRLNHHAWSAFSGWRPGRGEAHPRIIVTLEVERSSYRKLELPYPKKTVPIESSAVTDTGAMMVVVNSSTMLALGVEEDELIPMSLKITAANSSEIKLLGGMLLVIKATDSTGSIRSSRQLVYVAEGCSGIFLSQRVCKDLGIIPETFPTVGEFGSSASPRRTRIRSSSSPPGGLSVERAVTEGLVEMLPPPAVVGEMSDFREINDLCYDCLPREIPPEPPTKMPFPPIEENVPKLKEWIENYYGSSTFNKCEHKPLPLMRGSPPLKLHIDSKARPIAVHKYAPVPVHFEQTVKQELDRDVRMGVLEKVPIGTPSEWCSRMVVVTKQSGKPRRTVDLKVLNKAAKRQAHPTESPFHQAMSIPRRTYKTVTDAWNGYHSIPLEESDRHYTTFITKWGRYRYKVAPQGFRASGDGYTARYDEVTKDVTNCKRCVDDTLLFENTIEENFFKTCEYIHLVGSNGIILNKEKFQFCQKEVEYVGFKITEEGVKPSDETLKAIAEFPKPKNISGVRSFFGLVEQVSFAFSKTEVMAPFRHLLSPKTPFKWGTELDEAFEKGKSEIIKEVVGGIQSFDLNRGTCLQVDWSKEGIGFLLLQQFEYAI